MKDLLWGAVIAGGIIGGLWIMAIMVEMLELTAIFAT